MTEKLLKALQDTDELALHLEKMDIATDALQVVIAAARSTVVQEGPDGLPLVGGESTERSLSDLERACRVCIAEEQELPSPRNHYIAVFCDAVRLMRELGRRNAPTEDADGRRARVQAINSIYGGPLRPRDRARYLELGRKGLVPGTIAWSEHMEAWRMYAECGHGSQSAERLAERGGFGYSELLDLLGREPRTWRPT